MPKGYRKGTAKRKNIIKNIINALRSGSGPVEVSVEDKDKDYTRISRMLYRRNETKDIGMAKDPSKKSIWFYKRK